MSFAVIIRIKDIAGEMLEERAVGLEDFLDGLAKEVAQGIELKASLEQAPVRTGKLARSIVSRRESPGVYEVGSSIPYAIFTEYGTKYIKVGTPTDPRKIWKYKSSKRFSSTMPWLRATAEKRARGLSASIKRRVDAYLESGVDPAGRKSAFRLGA